MTERVMRLPENPETDPPRSISGRGGYAPYPNYKDSGIEWLGEIPAHWGVSAAKRQFTIQWGKVPQKDPASQDDLSEKYRVRNGDLVVCEGGRCGVVRDAPHRVCKAPGGGSRIEYLHYVFRAAASAKWFEVTNGQATVAHFTKGKLEELPIPTPPHEEQQAIAAFLDRETERIDTLIKKQERLIDLLRENRAALVSHAVAKGLDPNAPMKNSGVEWLGEIPAHWEVRRLKLLVGNKTDKANAVRNESRIALEHVESWTGKLRSGEGRDIGNEGKSFLEGDILFGKPRPYLAKVLRAPQRGACSGEFLVLRPLSGEIVAEFLEHRLRSKEMVESVNSSAFGTPAPRVEWGFMGNVEVAFPPDPNEQRGIADFLDRKTVKIDRLISKIHQVIKFQEELRSALISAVVTGKIVVSGQLS